MQCMRFSNVVQFDVQRSKRDDGCDGMVDWGSGNGMGDAPKEHERGSGD